MMNRKVARIIAIILAILLAFSVIYGAIQMIDAGSKAGAVTQAEIDELKRQKRLKEQQLAENKNEIDAAQTALQSAINLKLVYDQRIELFSEQIELVEQMIAEYDRLIAEQVLVIADLQVKEDEQWARYKARIREMEEGGEISYLSVLLSANDFADLLGRIDFVRDIMDADQKTYNDLVAARQETEAARQELADLEADAEAEKADLELQKAQQQIASDEAQKLAEDIQSDIAALEDAYEKLEKESKNLASDIAAAQKALEQQNAAKVVGTGQFAWPTTYTNRVTSIFGMRMHPILKQYKLHSGIDIAASGINGTNILASDSGTVIISKLSSSYGNYVVIDHGNGYTTLYAHMSKRSVSVGDVVKQGQVIGKVGTTGLSTAPHIHFEIIKNGTPVNPLNYFQKGSYVIV